VRLLRPPFPPIFPNWSDALTALLVTQADRKQKKADFTRNRTRPTTKSHPFPLPKTHTKATGDDGGDFQCAEKKGGKSDPRVRFLVKECALSIEQKIINRSFDRFATTPGT